jgi:O-antigen ligase/Flp pilus assembly protein TadD
MSSDRFDRLSLRLFAAVAAASPFAIDYRFSSAYLYDYADLPQSLFIQLATAAFAAVFFVRAARNPDAKGTLPFFLPALGAFLAWCALSLLWSTNPYEGRILLTHWSACAAAGLLVAQWTKTAEDGRAWLETLTWSCAAVSLIGILQAFESPLTAFIPQNLGPAATFGHRNMAVHFLALTAPLPLYFWMLSGERKRVWAYASVLTLVCAYVFLAASRAGLLVLLAEAAVAAALTLRFGRRHVRFDREKAASLALAVAVTAACVFLRPEPKNKEVGSLLTRVSSAVHHISTGEISEKRDSPAASKRPESSLRLRVAFWKNTLAMAKDRPVAGVGLGNYKVHYPAYAEKAMRESATGERQRLADAHNDYLQILAETGSVGLLLALPLFILTARRLTNRLLRENESPESFLVPAAVGTGLFGLALDACVSFPLYKPLPPFLLAAYLGILAGTGSNRRERPFPRNTPGPLAAVALLATLIAALHGGKLILSEIEYTRALDAGSRDDWESSLKSATASLNIEPARRKTLYLIGKSLVYSGRAQEAIRPLEELMTAYPFYINGLVVLGDAYAGAGRPRDALRSYKKALAIKPGYARAFHNMGTLFLKAGGLEKGFAALKEAVRLEPGNAQFQIHLGQAAIKTGDLELARTSFLKALETAAPEDAPFIREQLAALAAPEKN